MATPKLLFKLGDKVMVKGLVGTIVHIEKTWHVNQIDDTYIVTVEYDRPSHWTMGFMTGKQERFNHLDVDLVP